MEDSSRVRRRSFLHQVTGVIALTTGAGFLFSSTARATTDNDPTDPPGPVTPVQVASRQPTGVSDKDVAPHADDQGYGRGTSLAETSGLTDHDGGSHHDRARYGRGISDGDMTDPVARGRGSALHSPSGVSDNDTGAAADAANFGRGAPHQ
jgi:hypothetical protein